MTKQEFIDEIKSRLDGIPEEEIQKSLDYYSEMIATVCLGNGEQGFECCCDECDYYLLCFPEFDIKNISDNRTKQIENGQRT